MCFRPAVLLLAALVTPAVAQNSLVTRDPAQLMDTSFARSYAEWLPNTRLGSPLVDHLPRVEGIPTPRDILGYHVGAPRTLTYYADLLRYYRALAAASPRVMIETIGTSDEGRELVVVWVSSEANLARLEENRANLAVIADPRGRSDQEVRALIERTKPHYHLIGGLHSGETGPSEMLMELAYRLATETSPIISQIRENLYVSITPVADADGRDRNVDWFYQSQELGFSTAREAPPPARDTAARAAWQRRQVPGVPYWGKYAFHDNNRDINLSLVQMRAITDWYFTAHPPIMHDLHESLPLLYTYSGAAPQNPRLDPLLFAELPWFANFELAQMTKYGMPGVYTHAFMDGWSPGYLGSVSYNHNGLMKMYETQSGRDLDSTGTVRTPRRGGTDSASAESSPARNRTGSVNGGGPSGRGGGQDREWYRGIPIGPLDSAQFTRRANANYMQTGVLSSLQLASMFPATVLENFYTRTRNSIADGLSGEGPRAYVIPVAPEMTRAAELVNILRRQGIEVGTALRAFRADSAEFPAGSWVIKLDQPYGRLARNLLERQDYPDARLDTYDDSGWTMGLAFNVKVIEVKDSTVLSVPVTPVETATVAGRLTGNGTAGFAVAHQGSNNMITFRYQLRGVPMRIAEAGFTVGGVEFPAGSFLLPAGTDRAVVEAAVSGLGLTVVALDAMPEVASHEADLPRIAIYSQWGGTQSLGWYRLTFDAFGVPFDLIYKEQVAEGGLRTKYDVILAAEQNLSRETVMREPNEKPVPYQRSEKYKFLGWYGETADMTGGFGQPGVDAFAEFLERGGTLIAVGDAARLPIDFGWAGTVDRAPVEGLRAQRPVVRAEIVRTAHPVFYGYADSLIPVKYVGGQPFRVGVAHEHNVLARYVGGNDAVLTGLMTGADVLKGRPFVIDMPRAWLGQGRVILFANNPIYRWQNHGEFNMIFNSLLNWNDSPAAP